VAQPAVSPAPAAPAAPNRTHRLRRWLSASVLIGGVVVAVVVVIAALSGLLAPNPNALSLGATLAPPFFQAGAAAGAPLGTDYLGRNVLSLIIAGTPISLEIGLLATTCAATLGTALGLLSGYAGGWVDDVVMRLVDVQLAFPFILMALTFMAVSGPGLAKLIVILILSGWVTYARVVRGETLRLRELLFVESARAVGAPRRRILARHILPNVLPSVLVLAPIDVANNILLSAALTFIGLGIDPSIPSWGGLLANGRIYLNTSWWIATFPGLAIMVTVFGFNLLGDGLRDALDPRSRT